MLKFNALRGLAANFSILIIFPVKVTHNSGPYHPVDIFYILFKLVMFQGTDGVQPHLPRTSGS